MIEVQDLVKRYGGRCAVDHLSFTVEDGQIFGLLGPNGAGKSTTMNMMTGYLAVTEGRVVIQGHDVLEDPEAARRCVGYLPEVPPVYPEMTAGEYLLFAAELKKIPAGEREEQVERCSPSRGRRRPGTGWCATSPRATGSAWAWPRPFWAFPPSSSWMSPPWAWTPSRWWRSGS